MTRGNTQFAYPGNHQEGECQNCRKRMVGETGLMECLTGAAKCHWAMSFGAAYFCKQPSAKQLVNLKLQ